MSESASGSASAPRPVPGADLRLAVPAAAGWLAVAVVIAYPAAAPASAVVGWTLTVALVIAAVGTRAPLLGTVALAAGVAALLVTSVAAGAAHRHPEAMREAAQAGRFVVVDGVVSETVLAGDGSFQIQVTGVRVGQERMAVSVPARAFGEAAPSDIGIGAGIRLSGTLAETAPQDQIAFLVLTGARPETLGPSPWFLDWANELRGRFRHTAGTLPGDGGALLPGLAIGDTHAVGDELDEAMKSSSLSHLTAVSGANCAVVVGLTMLAGAALGVRRRWRVAAALCVLVGFTVLVTPEPSVVRAGVMAVVVLIGVASGRASRGVPVLALAVIVLLAIDPWLARQYGFVLSVFATAGLLLLSGPLSRALTRWLPAPVAGMIAIPLAAQLACQPVLILLEPTVPVLGVAANLLAAPAAPVATVLGLVACVLLPVLPGVGVLIAQLAWVPSAWIAAVAAFVASVPGTRLAWLPGAAGAVLLGLCTLLGLVAVFARPGGRVRRGTSSLLALVLVAMGGIAAGEALRTAVTRPAHWQLAQCDVGQGDAVLVRSADEIALVDTGSEPEALAACLDELGIDRVHLLVLTHFDLDHVGGVPAVLGRVDRALIGPSAGPDDSELAGRMRNDGARVDEVARGLSGRLGELRWRVLWPPSPLRGTLPGNGASVAVEFAAVGSCTKGCLESLFLGDLGEQPQSLVLATGGIRPVDVVKVAHHGSADQSARLYRRARATVGLIGVGADNDYGHPTPELLGILASAGTLAARSDTAGLVLLAPAPDGGVLLWSERGGVGDPG